MKETIKLALILFLITSISAGILGFSNKITEPLIAQADVIKDEKAKKVLLKDATEFKSADEDVLTEIKKIDGNISQCDLGFKDGELIGYIFKTQAKGYGTKPIEFMLSIDTEARVEGIEILNHEETPGLGANILRDSFKNSFKGKLVTEGLISSKQPSKDNEVQALTSATITTNGVLDEVNKLIKAYETLN